MNKNRIIILLLIFIVFLSCESEEEKNRKQAELNSSLFEAVQSNHYNETEDLLNRGAEVNAENDMGEISLIEAVEKTGNPTPTRIVTERMLRLCLKNSETYKYIISRLSD